MSHHASEKSLDDRKNKIPKLDAKIERVLAKHTFCADELIELGRSAGREQSGIAALEADLSSIKKDYQSKIEGAEVRRDRAFSKQADGFEMREVEAIIIYNSPKNGMKSIHFHRPGAKMPVGELLREEPMSEFDLQMEMQLIQAAKKDEANKAKAAAPKPGEPLNPVGAALAV